MFQLTMDRVIPIFGGLSSQPNKSLSSSRYEWLLFVHPSQSHYEE